MIYVCTDFLGFSVIQIPFYRCSTRFEIHPPAPIYSDAEQPELHKMRVLIGAPLKSPPKHQIVPDAFTVFPSVDSESINLKAQQMLGALSKSKCLRPPGLSTLVIYCTTDFTTVSKEVDVRTRRVQFIGLEVLVMPSLN